MPERLAKATRAAPREIATPLGQDQHTLPPSSSPRRSGRPSRACLRKGCAHFFQPERWNQRYCPHLECRKLVRRWQAAKRQRQRRSRPEVRRERAVLAQQERARRREEPRSAVTTSARNIDHVARDPPWSRSRKNLPPFCDRPGCYEARRPATRCAAHYCGDECRQAVRRVYDRERKWLSRQTMAGRFKRKLEYETRRETPHGGAQAAKDRGPNLLGAEHQTPVVNYQLPGHSAVLCGDFPEAQTDDSQTSAGSRPRAPPAT